MTYKYWNLDLPYKGSRDYLHGTDIISKLLEEIGAVESIVFQFHKVAIHPLRACYIADSDIMRFRSINNTCAIVVFTAPNKEKKVVALLEDEKQSVSSRIQYNEPEAIMDSIVDGNSIAQKNNDCFTFFEQIVALNKELLNELFGRKEWLFTRLDLKEYPIKIDNISIEFVHEVGGSIYKSNMLSNNVLLGCIFFSPRIV